VVIAIGRELYLSAKVSLRNAESGLLKALGNNARKNGRRYGGFLVHVGTIMIVVGLTGYGYHQFKEDFNMKPGERVQVGNYSLQYKGLRGLEKDNYEAVQAVVEVYDKSGFVGVMSPEKRFYKKKSNKGEPTTEVDILQRLKEDLYLILAGWEQDNTASITVIINPLLLWVWIGTGVIVFGIILCVLPRRRRDLELDALALDLLSLEREKQ
jgi:cytochrome c-type biogenesis protein CcmF